MEIDDVARLADALAGVRCTTPDGLAEWRYHGRLVARQHDDGHLVIRADLDYRDSMRRQFPGTFNLPIKYITANCRRRSGVSRSGCLSCRGLTIPLPNTSGQRRNSPREPLRVAAGY